MRRMRTIGTALAVAIHLGAGLLALVGLMADARGVPPPPERVEAQFSPDGQRLLTRFHGSVQVWDWQKGAPLWRTDVPVGLGPLGFSPDGSKFMCGKRNGLFSVWDAKTGQLKIDSFGQNTGVGEAEFLPDSERILTCNWAWGASDAHWSLWTREKNSPSAGPVRFWNAAERGPLHRYLALLSRDGEEIVVLSYTATAKAALIQKWRTRDGQGVGPVREIPLDRVYDQAVLLPDGRLVLSGEKPMIREDGLILGTQGQRLVRIVDLAHAEPGITQIAGEVDTSRCRLTVSPDGRSLLLILQDGTLQVFDIKAMKGGGFVRDAAKPVDRIQGAAWTGDGKRIVAWRSPRYRSSAHFAPGDSLMFFDAATLEAVGNPRQVSTDKWGETAFKYGVAFSPDYQWMCVTDAEGQVEVWQLPSLKLISSFRHGPKP